MCNLLTAYCQRLRKNKVFIGLFLFMILLAIIIPVIAHNEMITYNKTYTLESRFSWHLFIIGIVIAVFSAWFLGTEYSDGTIRNKIIAGNSRTKIYLASLCICVVGSLLLVISHQVILILMGTWLIAPFVLDITSVILLIGISLLIAITFASINTLFVLINQNKASSAIICLVVNILMLGISFYVLSVLFSSGMAETDSIIKSIYEFINLFLPTGQIFRLGSLDLTHATEMIIYDILICSFSTGIGIAIFKKKDLK